MTITQSSTRFVAVAAGIVLALSLFLAPGVSSAQAALSEAQIQSILSLLSSFGADAATINNVNAALRGQATPGTGGNTGGTGGACPALTRDLQQGSTGNDVKALQVFLNGSADTRVAASGAGSPGMETTTFGPATKAAVMKFQTKYNVTPIAGYVGAKTRAQIAAVCGGSTGGNTGGTPTAGTITVSAAAQPANSLAVAGAARVPFTTFTLTNNSGAAVTVNSVTVQRTGLGVDANFSGIVLLDSNGLQVGNSKTLNSNHQALIGDTGFTLQAGQSMTFTVAGNISSSGAQNGQVVSLQVVAINTTAAVSGSLPISGASQTINNTLTLGTVSTSTSAFDPGAAQTKNIGDAGIKFSGVKFTAGSAEDLKLYSIRWRQVGSVTSSDLANVVTIANGTTYPATVDSTGKYYTTIFPGGITVAKGESVDVYIQGDIVGSNASGRTVDFDIDKVTDVYFVGQLYGYGITPSGSFTPWFNGYVVTLSGASVTTISKDNAGSNAAQNIAVNVSNQPLGGYTIDLKGEAISVGSTVVTFATTTASTGLLTNVSIVNANGQVVAGPVDTTWVSGVMTATFTDTITYPLGKSTYSIRGKIPSSAGNGATVAATTVPSSGWTSITGQTTGNSVTLSQASFTMNTMTVKAGSLAVAVSATPASQNIVAGSQGFTFANIQLDATQSGEDVRLSSIALTEDSDDSFSGSPANLSSCQLWDGATALNGGSNVVNPSTTATSSVTAATFTFDNTLVVPKGTVKTLSLRCNLSGAADASSTFQWGITGTQISNLSVTGVSSGATITATGSTNEGQTMTVAGSGSVVATTDASSPSYTMAAGGQTGVTLGVYKLRATNEDVNLTRIGLKLASTASSSASDLTNVYLYKGATLIGTAQFVGSNANATSTLSSPLVLTRDTDTVITVKGDIAAIGTSQPGTTGHLLEVDIDTNGTNTQGTGAQSGSTVNASGSTDVAGVRIFRSFPTVAKDTLPTNTLNNGEQKLLRFRVTASANGDVGVARFTITVATTTASVTNFDIFAFTDSSYSTPVTGLSSDGGMEATDVAPGVNWVDSSSQIEIDATTSAGASTTVQVPAGQTRYFEVRGTVSGATTGASVQTTLLGDSAYPSLSGFMTTFNGVNADTNDDFIWSPNSTTTAITASDDWTNGFGVVGLPSGGISDTISR